MALPLVYISRVALGHCRNQAIAGAAYSIEYTIPNAVPLAAFFLSTDVCIVKV
jgi:hypothetical protein